MLKITVVTPPKNKPSGKWCPWMVEVPMEVIDHDKK